MSDATSSGDPSVVLCLLWRHHTPQETRRGPQRRLDVDTVVDTAMQIADEESLSALTMRRLADHLKVRPMSVYTYVPGRAELLDLMLDRAYGQMPRPPLLSTAWATNVRSIASLNLDLYERHPWAAQISTLRPPLGPGQLSKYEYELSAFAGSGLGDVVMDDALTYLLGFVRSSALDMQAARRALSTGTSDEQWWEHAGPFLSELVDEDQYPLAVRVGAAAGAAHASAHDPLHAYEFGLNQTMRAIELLGDGLTPT